MNDDVGTRLRAEIAEQHALRSTPYRVWYDMIGKERIPKPGAPRLPWRAATTRILWVNGMMLPVGTEYKTFETANFGWFILRESPGGGPRFAKY